MNNEFLTVEQIQDYLSDKRLYVVSANCGLSYPTLKRLADGDNGDYSTKTLRIISDYINGENT